MDHTPGTRLRSQVCSTEVVLVRAGVGAVELTCGGSPVIAWTANFSPTGSPTTGLDSGNQMGKRYTSPADDSFEVLVTKAGAGTLADGTQPLVLKEAKALPASD